VRENVPADRLLEFSVDQGWRPLCEFLGVPVPQSEFPNVNDRAAIKKTLNKLTRGAYVILALGSLGLASLIYGAFMAFS
jgi:hypothetical protein